MVEIEKIKTFYADLFEEELLLEMSEIGQLIRFKPNDILIDLDQQITAMPLLLEGAVKIMREDYDEGELLLYFLEKGETCALSMTCCLGERRSEIRATAETEGELKFVAIVCNEQLSRSFRRNDARHR